MRSYFPKQMLKQFDIDYYIPCLTWVLFDCVFYILKLNLISFFATAINSTSPKIKLIMVIKMIIIII